jgi:hypothetical protein
MGATAKSPLDPIYIHIRILSAWVVAMGAFLTMIRQEAIFFGDFFDDGCCGWLESIDNASFLRGIRIIIITQRFSSFIASP